MKSREVLPPIIFTMLLIIKFPVPVDFASTYSEQLFSTDNFIESRMSLKLITIIRFSLGVNETYFTALKIISLNKDSIFTSELLLFRNE